MGKFKKVAIIGFSKCGTTSLRKHLRKLGCDAQQIEIVYYLNSREGFDYAKKHLKGYKLVTLYRNNAERLWSAWHFFGFNSKMSFERFLQGTTVAYHGVGAHHICQCDYEYYENKWKEAGFDILSISLEDIKQALPKENVSSAGVCPQEAKDLVYREFKKFQESGAEYAKYVSPYDDLAKLDLNEIKLAELMALPKIKKETKMTLEDMISLVKSK